MTEAELMRLYYSWWKVMAWARTGDVGVKLGPLTVCWQWWHGYFGPVVTWLGGIVWDEPLRQMRKLIGT